MRYSMTIFSLVSVAFVLFPPLAICGIERGEGGSQGSQQGVSENAGASACGAISEKNVATVNIGLRYPKGGEGVDLGEAPYNDLKFYQEMSRGYSNPAKTANITDSFFSGENAKAKFLETLRTSIGSSSHVNLNYAGHGVMHDGKWAMVLPNMPPELARNCLIGDRAGGRGLSRISEGSSSCSRVNDYLVSTDDLKPLFEGKNVFGIIDACNSGGVDLGPKSSMLLASQKNEVAHQTLNKKNGAFTDAVKSVVDNSCDFDNDGDQAVSMHEVTEALKGQNLFRTTTASGASKSFQNPVMNNRSWMDCVTPSPTASTSTQKGKKCSKSFKQGDAARLQNATEIVGDSGQICVVSGGSSLRVKEAAQGSQGRVQVEIPPGKCSFASGTVPIQSLRLSLPGSSASRTTANDSVRTGAR